MRYAAFLRAINVGGHTVRMEQLRKLFEGLGLGSVETFIASGNVIFESAVGRAALETQIEGALEAALGYPVGTFLRTIPEVAAAARLPPFSSAAEEGTTYVGFLKKRSVSRRMRRGGRAQHPRASFRRAWPRGLLATAEQGRGLPGPRPGEGPRPGDAPQRDDRQENCREVRPTFRRASALD